MIATYRLNTKELGNNFINSIKEAYPDQDIEIMVSEQDETEYLCSSSANRERLDNAIENVNHGKNLITFDNLEQAIHRAEELG